MNKQITFLAVLLLVSTLSFGQLVLTNENFVWDTENLTGMTALHISPTIVMPAEGENMYWDYADLTSIGTANQTFHESDIPELPLSQYYYIFTNFIGSTITYTKERHMFIHEDGWLVEGLVTHYKNNDISAITGTQGDNITFPADTFLYVNPGHVLTFPTVLNNNTTDTMITETVFNLTIESLGYNNAACLQKQYAITNDLISGNGSLKAPSSNDPNNPYEAIQVKRHITLIDSFFVEGAAADPALLSVFGLTQGRITHTYDYYFYRAFTHQFMFRVACSPNFASAFAAVWDMELPLISNVDNQTALQFKVFPNPASNQLNFPHTSQFEIYDLNGKLILNGGNTNSCDISSLKKGMYLFRMQESDFVTKFTKE